MTKNTIISLIIVGVVVVGGAGIASATLFNQPTTEESNQTSSTAIASNYQEYSEDKLQSDKTNVLFFHASWCPTCTAAEKDIISTDSLPNTLNLLRVDYDTNTALRQKYDVVSQSTFVKVDGNGNKLDTAQGFTTAKSITDWALGSQSAKANSMDSNKSADTTQSLSETNNEPQVQPAITANTKSTGRFIDFADSTLKDDGFQSHVLFFNASWCPSCRRTETDLNNNLSKIPEGVQILKVDYDSNLALRQKYGVTSQHTFVQVDMNGEKVQSQLGLATTQDIIDFIN